MSSFKIAFDTARRIVRDDFPNWHSSYYRYAAYHREYCKIRLEKNPILGTWSGDVACEYNTKREKKEVYEQAKGDSSIEVVERLEEMVKECLGEEVYEGREETNR